MGKSLKLLKLIKSSLEYELQKDCEHDWETVEIPQHYIYRPRMIGFSYYPPTSLVAVPVEIRICKKCNKRELIYDKEIDKTR